MAKKKECTTCQGFGVLDDDSICPICAGDGVIYEGKLTEDDFIQDLKKDNDISI